MVRAGRCRFLALLLALALVLAGLVGRADAAFALRAGAVDPTFGEDGAVGFGPGFTAVGAVERPDGVIEVVGMVSPARGRGGDPVVIYLAPDGEVLDAVNLDHGGEEMIYGMASASDGSLVLVGGTIDDPATNSGRPLVIRVTPDGEPDPAFGDRGYASPAGLVGPPTVAGIAPDGHVLIGGLALNGTRPGMDHDDWAIVARLDAAGQPDRTFGTNGVVRYSHSRPVSWSNGLVASAIAFQPEGRIIVGLSLAGMILGLTPDGHLDPTFGGGDGVAGVDAVGGSTGIDSITVAPDGSFSTVNQHVDVSRYRPNGSPDVSFGQNGTVSFQLQGFNQQRSALDAEGRLYVASETDPATTRVRRILPGGTLDQAFGDIMGGAPVRLGWDTAVAALVPDADGLVVVGTDTESDMSTGLVVTRLLTEDAILAIGDDGPGGPAPDGPEPYGPASGSSSGYWALGSDGRVYAFGSAPALGDAGPGAVDLEPTPSGRGYWVLGRDGTIRTFGDAPGLGNVDGTRLATGELAASLSATPSGRGYWVFTNRGRAIPFGDAAFLGDMSQIRLNGAVLGSVATPSGHGYYMVASDGGIFAFGDAAFVGSMGGRKLNAPVQGLVPDGDGRGYWLVGGDGGIFAFDAPFHGSMGGTPLNKPISGMVRYGDGYLMVGADGGIFNFSNLPFSGSLGDKPPTSSVVAVAALP